MKNGDYLISKVNVNTPTWHKDGIPASIFEVVKNEKCEIVDFQESNRIVILKCRKNIIGFSLDNIDLQYYEYYQKYFYEYGTSLKTIRKEKLEKLEKLEL